MRMRNAVLLLCIFASFLNHNVIICPIAIAYSMGQITRNSSGDEIANVNFLYFLYDDIVHAQENTIDSCINSATDRFLQRRYTEFSEIPQ